jgi:hypothetical protein
VETAIKLKHKFVLLRLSLLLGPFQDFTKEKTTRKQKIYERQSGSIQDSYEIYERKRKAIVFSWLKCEVYEGKKASICEDWGDFFNMLAGECCDFHDISCRCSVLQVRCSV